MNLSILAGAYWYRGEPVHRVSPCASLRSYAVWLLVVISVGLTNTDLSAQERQKNEASASESLTLEIVDANYQPVAHCNVRWRAYPEPKSLQVSLGELTKGPKNNGFSTRTNAAGKVSVAFPLSKSSFQFFVEEDGFGPYFGQWNQPQTGEPIPDKFQVVLDSAWTAGGVIIDEAGVPVENATIHPRLEFKKRKPQQLGIGTRLHTDAQGRWQFARVPISQSEIKVEIKHPDFRPFYATLSKAVYNVGKGQNPTKTIVASRGLSVDGTITNAMGQPIEGALVRTKVQNDERRTKTDEKGRYRLTGFQAETSRIVVSAASYALDMKDVIVKENMEPVDFVMQPGGHVKVRVLDEKGKGIPKSRIFFQRWRGKQIEYFEFDHIRAYTDENGSWEWDEAPLDTFHADICRTDGMQLSSQPIVAREEEYVFRPPRRLIVRGQVIDAATKKAVTEFRVIAGIQGSQGSHISWLVNEPYRGQDGKYRLPHKNHAYFAHLVRIEADGYLPKLSRKIQFDEEEVTVNFELERGKDVSQTVTDVTDRPVSGADVVLGVAGSQISIENGRIDDSSTFNASRVKTDEKGQFTFPPQLTKYQLVVLHEKGFALVNGEPSEQLETIVLEPWAKLKGVYKTGKTPVVNQVVSANSNRLHEYGPEGPNIFAGYESTTGKDGGFEFNRIPAGDVRVRRRIIRMVRQGATEVASTPIVKVETQMGATTEMQLGGVGAVLTGQLTVAIENAEADWRQASIWLEEFLPDPPPLPVPPNIANNAAERAAWYETWKLTPDGRNWSLNSQRIRQLRENQRMYYATVGENGHFKIQDVIPGDYRLRGDLSQQELRVTLRVLVQITADDESKDLGALEMK